MTSSPRPRGNWICTGCGRLNPYDRRKCVQCGARRAPAAAAAGVRLTLDLAMQIRLAGLPEPVAEHRFHPSRKWRFDLAWPDVLLAVEREGGTWTRGRHVRGQGYANDCEKYSEAALLGWCVLRFTADMIRDGRALAMIEKALAERRPCDGH